MKRQFAFALLLITFIATVNADVTVPKSDWSQWHGNDRTNLSPETGLLKSWNGTPPVTWSIRGLGNGYGSLAIKGDKILVQGIKDKQSTVFCLNLADGKTVWATTLGPALDQDRGGGPRGTPTIDNDRIYALS